MSENTHDVSNCTSDRELKLSAENNMLKIRLNLANAEKRKLLDKNYDLIKEMVGIRRELLIKENNAMTYDETRILQLRRENDGLKELLELAARILKTKAYFTDNLTRAVADEVCDKAEWILGGENN